MRPSKSWFFSFPPRGRINKIHVSKDRVTERKEEMTMKKFRTSKFLALALTLAMVLAVAGCGGNGGGSTPPANGSGDGGNANDGPLDLNSDRKSVV